VVVNTCVSQEATPLLVAVERHNALPNHVSEQAHKLAADLGLSLDQLIALALNRLLNDSGAEVVTATLEAVYAHEPSTLDPGLGRLQSAALGREAW